MDNPDRYNCSSSVFEGELDGIIGIPISMIGIVPFVVKRVVLDEGFAPP